MSLYDWIAQLIGIAAMGFNIFSYQQKKSGTVILFQLFGGALFAINFYMIGAPVGCLLNLIAVFRAIVFYHKDKFHTDHVLWLLGFIATFFVTYAATFLLFGTRLTPSSAVIELLPVIGLTATTISFRYSDAAVIRKFAWISSPSWLIYNVIHFTLGGIICEALSLISVVIGTLRHDQKKN